MAKTHNGNLNRSQVDAKPGFGIRGNKDNSNVATKRKNSLPKAEKVKELTVEAPNKGAAIKAGKKQSTGKPGQWYTED